MNSFHQSPATEHCDEYTQRHIWRCSSLGLLLERAGNFKFWSFLFVVNLLLRIATFYTPILDVDETQFAGFAHVLLDGGRPYLESLDTKPLGIYLFYALCFEVFGWANMYAVHFVTALIQFLTGWLLYRVFLVFDQRAVGRWTALFYIVFSTTFIPKYTSTSINSIMVVFLVGSVLFMAMGARSRESGIGSRVLVFDLLAGFVLGAGFLFKYTAGIQWVLFIIFSMPFFKARVAGAGNGDAGVGRRVWYRWFWRNILFGIAFIMPFLIHGLVLYKLGVWDDFVEWSILGSGKYIGQGGATISFWKSFVLRFGTYILATAFLWIFMARGLITGAKSRLLATDSRLMFLLWFFLSLIPVCMSGRFYPHYFIQLLPALCGLAAIGFTRPMDQGRRLKAGGWVLGLVVLPALFFWVLRLDYHTYLKHFPDDQIYEQQEIGLKIKNMAGPEDKIFVWGFATGIDFYSGLRPASRFLWADLLTGRTPGPFYARINQDKEGLFQNPYVWALFWKDLKKNKPAFFIDTSPANIHDYGRFPIKNYPELYTYLQDKYEKVANIQGADIYRLKQALFP